MTTHPLLLKEWDYKNNKINPQEVVAGNERKVYWICEKGHSWKAQIKNRTINKTNCPYCSGKKVLIGFNDLKTNFPELAKEWDYNKNSLTPEEITYGSNKVVNWVCNEGHTWEATIYSRTKLKNNCPYCSGHRVLKGFNDLTTTHPSLLDYWDYEKNIILPTEVSKGCHKKIHWKCNICNKEWITPVYSMINKKTPHKCKINT